MLVKDSAAKIKRKWYSMGLPRALELSVWIFAAVTATISIFDLDRYFLSILSSGTFIQWVPMKIASACCLIFAVAALIIIHLNIQKVLRNILSLFFILLILIPVLVTTYAYLHLFFTGHELIFSFSPSLQYILEPDMRMDIIPLISFFMISCILLFLLFDKPNMAHALTIPVTLMTYFFLVSYFLGVYSLFEPKDIIVSINTSIAVASLCAAIYIIRPDSWFIKVFSSSSSGAIIARQLLLPLIFVPIIIGWLRIYGEHAGYFKSEEGVVLVAVAYTICFAILAWLTARSVNKIDMKRHISEQASLKSKERLELLSDIASKLLLTSNPQKQVNELCQQVIQFLDCHVFFNYLLDESGRLHLNAFSGIDEKAGSEIEWLDNGVAVCGCVARDGSRIIAENIQGTSDPRTKLVKSFGVRAYACHPLLSHDKVIGTLSFGTKTRDRFSEDDISLMKIVSDQVSIAMSRIRNENALRESEDRFRTIAVSLPVAISITRISDATIRFTNDAYDKAFGFKGGQLYGKKAQDQYADPEKRAEIIDKLKKEGFLNNVEAKVKRSDGTEFWIMASISSIIYDDEPAYLSAMIDISENKKAQEDLVQLNRTLNALGKSSQVMMHTSNELQYLKEVCKIIIEDCGHLMVWVGYARNDKEKNVEPVAFYGLDKGYIEKMHITWDESERGRGPTGTAIRTCKPTVCRNMLTDPNFEPWRDDAIKRGYASSLVLPLISEDSAFGAISIYSKQPDAFLPAEVDLLTDLANDLAYGISNIRLQEFESQAAETIKQSEEKYRLLFEGMVEGFALHEIILDGKGNPYDYRFLSANPAFEKQTGLKASEIVGKTVRQVMPDIEEYWIKTYGEVALTGKSIDFENYTSQLKAYFRVSAFSPQRGYFAVICENITRRITAEKELKSTKDYLENLINYANAPIIVWNKDTEIQLFNHAFEHLTGYSAEEVEGKKLDLLFPETSLKESNEKIKNALTKNWVTIEIPILTKNNEIRTILWNSANIFDTDNKTVLSTIAQGNDITERITAEREVRKAKEKLDLALENANIGIWSWDVPLDYFEWDERIGKMLQINDHHANKFEDFEKCIYEEDVPHFKRAIHNVLEGDIPFDTIFRVKLPSGDFKYIDAKAKVAKDKQGKPVRISGVCLDITEMKRGTDQTLFNLNEDLLRSNKELEQFAYVASHDLQEPLRMISSFTQLLAMRYKDKLDEEANDFINFAVDGAMRMQRLINDLLQYSRINTRGKRLSTVNTEGILQQTMHNLAIKITERNALITHDQMPEIFADEGQMVQLFQNLIENAIKFSEVKPKIHISAREEKNMFVFAVKDNGIGIEPQYYERIFQIFQRLHAKDEYGGTGIGLAICKRIVERHGGKIWVESKNSHGTTFKFTIRKQ